MSTQTDNGRAFEWAIGKALESKTGFSIEKNAFTNNAETAFSTVSEKKKNTFNAAAIIAIEHILNKEHAFIQPDAHGKIIFNTDASGKNGDVRDVLLIINDKMLGISCKNNHEALKHSRLSGTVDFIKTWGVDLQGCSSGYWDKIRPLFNELRTIKEDSNGTALWSNISDKANRYYWPLLDAWAEELNRFRNMSSVQQAVLCKAIISYLVGKHDFYKVICDGSKGVEIQAYNFNNSLATKRTKYPDSIIDITNKNGGQYSKTIVFNHGYSINFRIHSASSKVEPSLKFDIKAIGLPTREVYQNTLDIR